MSEPEFIDIPPHELRSFVLGGLKSFLGQTSDEIKNYWKTLGIPEAFISEGIWDDTREPFLIVMASNVGRPDFEATFKNGLCVSQSVSVNSESVADCMDFLRRIGFSYSNRLKRWSKPGEDYVWRIQELYEVNYSLIARRLLKKKVALSATISKAA